MQKEYTIRGTVTVGRQLGRMLGFPTANIPLAPAGRRRWEELGGVWLARVVWDTPADGEERRWGLVNVGTAPTVAPDGAWQAEAWLFDFAGDLYGCGLRLDLLHRLRPERRFGSVEELRGAMEADKKNALNIIADNGYTL